MATTMCDLRELSLNGVLEICKEAARMMGWSISNDGQVITGALCDIKAPPPLLGWDLWLAVQVQPFSIGGSRTWRLEVVPMLLVALDNADWVDGHAVFTAKTLADRLSTMIGTELLLLKGKREIVVERSNQAMADLVSKLADIGATPLRENVLQLPRSA